MFSTASLLGGSGLEWALLKGSAGATEGLWGTDLAAENTPSARQGCAAWTQGGGSVSSDRAWLYGGVGRGPEGVTVVWLGDMWEFDLNFCGDASTATGGAEECDDGNNIDSDGCLGNCTLAACGDGVVYPGVESCDDGNKVSGDGCSASCTVE